MTIAVVIRLAREILISKYWDKIPPRIIDIEDATQNHDEEPGYNFCISTLNWRCTIPDENEISITDR